MTCAIYCRLSKEDKGRVQESESIQNQRSLLLRHAVEQGWDIYNVYCDEDYSGVDPDRPAFRRLLEDGQAGRYQILLCKSQSRFTRDIEAVERYIHGLFPQWGIRFIALVDGIDTQVKGNKKARQISGLVNEWYLEDLSESVRAVLDQKRRTGKYIGSLAPYGYRKDEKDHNKLVVDDEAAPVVREIFRLYLEGMGTRAIARQLSQQGIPGPNAYKREKGLRSAGEKGQEAWSATTISRILKSEAYLGHLVQGVKRKVGYKSPKLVPVPREEWFRCEGTHEAIVAQDVFEAVQRRIGQRVRSDGSGAPHPLAGKVRCGRCGGTMQRLSHRYKGQQRSYLQCKLYAATRNAPQCAGDSLRLDALVLAVEQEIKGLLARGYRLPGPDAFRRDLPVPAEEATAQRIARLEQEQRRVDGALKALYLDRAAGRLEEGQFQRLNRALGEDGDRIEARLAGLRRSPAQLPECPGDQWYREIEEMLAAPLLSRELAELLIDYIEVGEKDAVAGERQAVIHWKI